MLELYSASFEQAPSAKTTTCTHIHIEGAGEHIQRTVQRVDHRCDEAAHLPRVITNRSTHIIQLSANQKDQACDERARPVEWPLPRAPCVQPGERSQPGRSGDAAPLNVLRGQGAALRDQRGCSAAGDAPICLCGASDRAQAQATHAICNHAAEPTRATTEKDDPCRSPQEQLLPSRKQAPEVALAGCCTGGSRTFALFWYFKGTWRPPSLAGGHMCAHEQTRARSQGKNHV